MNKLVLTSLVLAFALCTVAAAAEEARLPAPAADPVAIALVPAPASAASCPATAATPAVSDTAPDWLEKACCGNRCSSDSQCTAFCGGPGKCVWVNSCCRQCSCFQVQG